MSKEKSRKSEEMPRKNIFDKAGIKNRAVRGKAQEIPGVTMF